MQRILLSIGLLSLSLFSACSFSMGIQKNPTPTGAYEQDRDELIKALNSLSSRVTTLETQNKKE